jgi:hypothetical protein
VWLTRQAAGGSARHVLACRSTAATQEGAGRGRREARVALDESDVTDERTCGTALFRVRHVVGRTSSCLPSEPLPQPRRVHAAPGSPRFDLLLSLQARRITSHP